MASKHDMPKQERLDALLDRVARQHQTRVETISRRVEGLHARSRGLVPKAVLARALAAKMGARVRIEMLLAKGARHVSGTDVLNAVEVAQREGAAGRTATLGYWSHTKDMPEAIGAAYMKAVDAIADAGLTATVSIKADQVRFDRDLLFPLFERARERGVGIHFDSQAYETTDQMLAMVEEAQAQGTAVSASISARWARSRQDAERLMARGIALRIVKGQGADPTNRKIDPRKAFMAIAEACAGRAIHVGVATHDRRVAEPALDLLARAGTPCALEQLISLPRLDSLADRRSIPVQVYVAYGRFGLPYAVAEVIRRPAIAGWILRDLLALHRGR